MEWKHAFWIGFLVLLGVGAQLLIHKAVQTYGVVTVIAVCLMFVGSKIGREFLVDTLGIALV